MINWAIGNMGFHLNEVLFVSINVELLTLKVMFHISKLLLTPLLWGEASFCHILQPAGGGRSLLLLFFFYFFIFVFIIIIF